MHPGKKLTLNLKSCDSNIKMSISIKTFLYVKDNMEAFYTIISGGSVVFFSLLAVLIFIIWGYFILISAIIGLGLFVLWIITLIDCIKRDNKDFPIGGTNAKLIWILLLLLVRNIVPVVYYILIMRDRK